jgi:hypothetical protein
LTIDCKGCIECRLLLFSMFYIIEFVAVLLLDLIPCWLHFKMSFYGDWLKVVGHTYSFSLELWHVENYHRLNSFFLCCFLLYLFIFCPGFQDILDCLFYTIYTADLWFIRQLSWANVLSLVVFYLYLVSFLHSFLIPLYFFSCCLSCLYWNIWFQLIFIYLNVLLHMESIYLIVFLLVLY